MTNITSKDNPIKRITGKGTGAFILDGVLTELSPYTPERIGRMIKERFNIEEQ